MDIEQALTYLNECQDGKTFLAYKGENGCIAGGTNPQLLTIPDLLPIYTFDNTFTLYQKNESWHGKASRYGHRCHFPPQDLETIVDKICDFYQDVDGFDVEITLAEHIMRRLAESNFSATRENVGRLGIIGHVKGEEMISPGFSIVRFGKLYGAIDLEVMERGLYKDPIIVCSRSIEEVIETLLAYYGKTTE
jgi:hypothetical protein